jgi:hypothetical protein
MRGAWLICLWMGAPLVAQPSLEEILSKVAANQDKAVEARRTVVYKQNTYVRLLHSNGKVSREEKREYTVTPTAKGTEKKLVHFEGRYEKGGKLLPYDHPHFQYKDADIDGDLIEDLTNDVVNDRKSRDAMGRDLFPLTAEEQEHYKFKLAGRRKAEGVEAWRITFEPDQDEFDERPWAGEVLVHPEEFQPISVTTRLATKIPLAVKLLLGTDIQQLGFQLTCRKMDEGLWFPASYGTEFHLKVLFGYKRTVTMSVTNSEFRRTSAESTIEYKD